MTSGIGESKPLAVLVDVDGTLVDSVYHHALAWQRAFEDHGVHVPAWVLHRHIGMGGDQLIAAVSGEGVEHRIGDRIREAEARRYGELIDEVRPLPGAREMIVALKDGGCRVSLATSAKEHEIARYLELLTLEGVLDDYTTADDVERTKPDPDMIRRALHRVGGPPAVVVGDATWDSIAARAADIGSVGVLTGGFSAEELRGAGATEVFEDLDAVTEHLISAVAGQDGAR